MNNKMISMISLAQRAGKVISGTEMCIDGIRKNKIKYIIIASDASDRTKKTVTNKCKFYKVDYNFFEDSTLLNKTIGKENRMVIGVTDKNFAMKIKQMAETK